MRVRRSWIGITVLLGLGVLGAFAPNGAPRMPTMEKPDPSALLEGVVHRVIDGDSVELFVNGRVGRFELSGVDAPDLLDGRESQVPGAMAAKQTLELLIVGERLSVMIDPARPEDAAGHARAFVFRDPDRTLVNLEMVRLGLAKHPRRHGSWNSPVFEWAQEQARSARKGIWDPEFDAQPELERVEEDQKPEPEVVEPTPETKPARVVPEPEPEPVVSATRGDTVYVTKSGSKYHREGCRHLGDDGGRAMERELARKSFEPCKVCRPDDPDED